MADRNAASAFSNVASVNTFYSLGILGLGLALHKRASMINKQSVALPGLFAACAMISFPVLKLKCSGTRRLVLGSASILAFFLLAARCLHPLRKARAAIASNSYSADEKELTLSPAAMLKHHAGQLSLGVSSASVGSLLLTMGTEAILSWNRNKQWWMSIMPMLASQLPALVAVLNLSRRGEVIVLMAFALSIVITYSTLGYGTAWILSYRQSDYRESFSLNVAPSLSSAIFLLTMVSRRTGNRLRPIGIAALACLVVLMITENWRPVNHSLDP